MKLWSQGLVALVATIAIAIPSITSAGPYFGAYPIGLGNNVLCSAGNDDPNDYANDLREFWIHFCVMSHPVHGIVWGSTGSPVTLSANQTGYTSGGVTDPEPTCYVAYDRMVAVYFDYEGFGDFFDTAPSPYGDGTYNNLIC